MIGIGIGVSTLEPTASVAENPTVKSLSIGAGVWFVLSGVIASFAGGYAAGRLAGKPKESTAGWHGLTAWALTTLVIFYLLTSTLGSVAGGLYSGLSSALGGLGRTATTAAQTAMGAAAPALSQAADPFGAIEHQVRDQTAQTLARAANIPVEEARNRVQQYEQQYRQAAEQARQQAVEAGRTAARTASRAALWGSIALILGALAAWFGGRAGAVHPTITAAALSYARRRG